ncbi:neuropeptide CCHamide-2 receptor-like isoform X3 [Pomacea canaliculata]|nr:neuropeptide CCHamide-2 receptor-like isoform X3 [Pomacea canaliculata]XP_025095291.1 neuropeptide CCHamide-2 receptor-like isoform X3 [Pomacea canaliculata]
MELCSPCSMARCPCNDSFSNDDVLNDTEDSAPDLEPPMYLMVYTTALALLIFLVGVLGNLLVILVVCRIRSMRTRMNYFLVSLSLADLLVLLVCEPTAIMVLYTKDVWLLGEAMCKIVPFLENAAHHCSILSLLAISIERYLAICHPFRQHRRGKALTDLLTICLSWVVALLVAIPFALMSELTVELFYDGTWQTTCRTTTRIPGMQLFIILDFALVMILPLGVLTVLYTIIILRISASACACLGSVKQEEVHGGRLAQSRNQVVWMMVAVVVLFYVCLLPMRAFILWLVFSPASSQEDLGFVAFHNVLNITRLLTYINSAGNPIIYGLLSTKFRKAFRTLMPACTMGTFLSRASTTRSSTPRHRTSHVQHHLQRQLRRLSPRRTQRRPQTVLEGR